jgi:uncharacterized protein (DUF427 family)
MSSKRFTSAADSYRLYEPRASASGCHRPRRFILKLMPKAIWEGTVIAESDQCVVVEGNQYFPIESVRKEYLEPVGKTTVCSWKGTASYYDIVVNGKRNAGAAWYYAEPRPAADEIKGRVAFWKGVRVE